MARTASEIERAVARTLRDSLETLQRSTEEVDQAVADLVSACASARPGNTLPPMLRAQTAAASLAATLDVLSRFLTLAMQPGMTLSAEIEPDGDGEPVAATAPTAVPAARPAPPSVATQAPARMQTPVPAPTAPAPAPVSIPVIEMPSVSSAVEVEPEPAAVEEALRSVVAESAAPEIAPAPALEIPVAVAANAPVVEAEAAPEVPAFEIAPPDPVDIRSALELLEPIEEAVAPQAAEQAAAPAEQGNAATASPVIERPAFDVAALPVDQQELHRRANRVAKVSMQDIKMLRPADVVAGKENNDICLRLSDDIERAHKEYERRFHAILDHPVDYFYAWMVEILGEGDPRALGSYPYSSPVARR